jgi:2'-5' RNA ligase
MANIRTFIAIEAPVPVKMRAEVLVETLSDTPANVKWVAADQMHFTLKFLGEVESNEVPRICQALAAATENCEKFEVLARGAGAFPNVDRPRTLWLGVTEGEDAFVCLHRVVEEALLPFFFRREQRRFRPHLTIGRVRRSERGIEELAAAVRSQTDFVAGSMTVDQLLVFASRLRRGGPQYQSLCRVPLGG